MSSIPSNISRVPNLLVSQAQVSSLTRSNLALFRVQQQLASGVRFQRYSEDSVGAAVVTTLNDRLHRADQRLRNMDHATRALAVLDQGLGEASDLVLEAKDIASTQVNVGSTKEERAAQAEIVQSLIQNLYQISNRQSGIGYMFAGSRTGSPAIESLLGGYRYRGEGNGITTDLGLGSDVPLSLAGNNAIGSTSSRVEGSVDFNPDLTADTRLVDLDGARGLGITLGTIEFSFDAGPRTQIDLTAADTIQDVADTIENALRDYETANSVTILGPGGVAISGPNLAIDVVAGAPNPTLEFFDIGTNITAQDLGLTASTPFFFDNTQPDGLDLAPRLTWTTPIAALTGVTGPLGHILAKNLGQSRDIDLSTATTLQDVRNLIQGAGIGLRVEINAAGNGINVVNETAAGTDQAMAIEEVNGNNLTATRLGIRTFAAETLIADFNDGRGVQIVDGSVNPQNGLPDPLLDIDFRVTLGDAANTAFTVDLRPQDIITVQTVIDRINAEAAAQGINVPADFNAALADGPNGFMLTQNATYPGAITIAAMNNSLAAEQLGLMDGSYDTPSATFRAEDRAKVRVDNLFTHLIDLRDALLNNDTIGITLAGESLEKSVDRLAQARALVGGHANRVDGATRRQEDQVLVDQKTRSEVQDLDYTEASVRFSLLQTQLQAGLQVTALSASRTLLDFLG